MKKKSSRSIWILHTLILDLIRHAHNFLRYIAVSMENEEVGQQQGVEEKNLVPTVSLTARDQEKAISSSPSPSSPSSSSSSVCPDPLTMATIAVSELCDVAKVVNHIELAAICHSVNLLVDDTEADISRLVHSSSSGSDISSKNHQLRFYSSVSDKKATNLRNNRLKNHYRLRHPLRRQKKIIIENLFGDLVLCSDRWIVKITRISPTR